MQDAIAIVGLSNVIDPIALFNPDDLELRNEDASQRLTLKPTGEIEISTTKYDKSRVPSEGEPPAKKQTVQNIILTKEGTLECTSEKYNESEVVETSSTISTDEVGNIKLDSLVDDTNQTIEIKNNKNIEATTGGSKLTMTFGGDVTIEASGNMNLTAGNVMTLSATTVNIN